MTRLLSPKPIRHLRHHLRRLRLDGCIVPHRDEYANEFIPDCFARLRFISGFSGSAGWAIIAINKAALFVDGRYTLQAHGEVDNHHFTVHNFTPKSISEWLITNIKPKQRLGYDPRLHTRPEISSIRHTLSLRKVEFIALDNNPIDAIWVNRPARPGSAIAVHDRRYHGQDWSEKMASIVADLRDRHCTATVLSTPSSVAWLFNIRGQDLPHTPFVLSRAIVTDDGRAQVFFDLRSVNPPLAKLFDDRIEILPLEYFDQALTLLAKKKPRVLLDQQSSCEYTHRLLSDYRAEIIDYDDLCSLRRAVKNATEITSTRRAHRRDGVSLVRFLAWLDRQSPGTITESGAAKKLDQLRAEHRLFRIPSFPTIAATGANAAIVHYFPKNGQRLKNGELFLLDSGGQYLDGTTDITRTVLIGAIDDDDDRLLHYSLVLKAHIHLARSIFSPQATGAQLDALARATLWRYNLDYNHGTGHGVGVYGQVHEGPYNLSSRSNRPIPAGSIISIEPGYYQTSSHGIRLENIALINTLNDRSRKMHYFDILSLAPFDRRLIIDGILSKDEQIWLDTYHARVRYILSPYLNHADAQWLAIATQPINAIK